MGKLQDQKGFSAVELLLVLAVVVVIGVVGLLVYSKHNKTKTVSATTTSSSTSIASGTYKDPDNAYTLTYPSGWIVKQISSHGQDLAASVSFTPPNAPTSGSTKVSATVSEFKSSNLTGVFDTETDTGGSAPALQPQSLTINGYKALYDQDVEQTTTGVDAAPGTTADYYAVTGNGTTLFFSFFEKQDGTGGYDVSSLAPAYTSLVKSVKFLN